MFGRDKPKNLFKQTSDDPSSLLFLSLVLSLHKPTATDTFIRTNKCAGGTNKIALITLKSWETILCVYLGTWNINEYIAFGIRVWMRETEQIDKKNVCLITFKVDLVREATIDLASCLWKYLTLAYNAQPGGSWCFRNLQGCRLSQCIALRFVFRFKILKHFFSFFI